MKKILLRQHKIVPTTKIARGIYFFGIIVVFASFGFLTCATIAAMILNLIKDGGQYGWSVIFGEIPAGTKTVIAGGFISLMLSVYIFFISFIVAYFERRNSKNNEPPPPGNNDKPVKLVKMEKNRLWGDTLREAADGPIIDI